MTILGRGGTVDLDRKGLSPTQLSKVTVGLGWSPNRDAFTDQEFTLNASALVAGTSRRLIDKEHFVHRQHPATPDELLRHTDDSPGVDEALIVNLTDMSYAARIVLMITIFEGPERGQTFEHVDDTFVSIIIEGQEKLRYELDSRSRNFSSLAIADFTRPDLEAPWSFRALAQDFVDESAMLRNYGVTA